MEIENIHTAQRVSTQDLNEQLEIFKEELSCLSQENKLYQIAAKSLVEEKYALHNLVEESKIQKLEFDRRVEQYEKEKEELTQGLEVDAALSAQQVLLLIKTEIEIEIELEIQIDIVITVRVDFLNFNLCKSLMLESNQYAYDDFYEYENIFFNTFNVIHNIAFKFFSPTF